MLIIGFSLVILSLVVLEIKWICDELIWTTTERKDNQYILVHFLNFKYFFEEHYVQLIFGTGLNIIVGFYIFKLFQYLL